MDHLNRPRPQRIASLLASGTEILYALGLGEKVVAISHECDYPAEVLTKPRVTRASLDAEAPSLAIDDQVRGRLKSGSPLFQIDVDKLAKFLPDLIATQSQCEVCAASDVDVKREFASVES